MANNRFFDETKIIKKNPPVTQPEVQPEPLLDSEEIISEPIIEKPKKKRKKIEDISIQAENDEPQNIDVTEQYKNTVQQIIKEEPDVAAAQPKKPSININIETSKPKKPVYNYSRKNGKINIEAKSSMKDDPIINPLNNDNIKYQMIEEMLEKTKQELLRLSIELDVHAQVAILIDEPKKQIYENKTKNIQDEIKYNEKRKLVLEKMLNSR